MSKTSLCIARGEKLFNDIANHRVPFSFVYGDVKHNGVEGLQPVGRKETAGEQGIRMLTSYRLDDLVKITVDAAFCAEFGECEYTIWFENDGDRPSPVLTDWTSLDTVFAGEAPLLRSCLGDHDNNYQEYETDLSRRSTAFSGTTGRATHIVFPYFNLVHGDGGTLFALGWAGSWDASFAACDDETFVVAKNCHWLRAVLMPGEKIRSALVVLLPYTGRDYDDATNLWREWWRKYNMPKASAAGDDIQPFSTSCWCDDTGLPNSDGSISERSFTWKPTLEKIVAERVQTDFRWFDAGWYFDPDRNTVERDWWGTVGSWELDTTKWPGKSFRESNEACHANGMKVFVWFEPERVTHVDGLVKNHGYKPEWGIQTARCITNNIGNEECRQWTLKRIVKMMDDNAVDLYREDNNSDPTGAWGVLDAQAIAADRLPHYGIAENMMIQGHYKLWDDIIAYCAANGKCTFVDSCASGGGRNDIESMRRGVPFMRSDADRAQIGLRLSMTASFCRWIPFHGAAIKEVKWQLDPVSGKGGDAFVNRASLLPIYNITGYAYTHNPDIDFDNMRHNFDEWKSVRDLLTKDMYILSPWHFHSDLHGWAAFAYDDPEKGDSILLAFRQEECHKDSFTAKLQFAIPNATYSVTNDDTGETVEYSGRQLAEDGIAIVLDQPRASALLRIKRCN